MDSKRCTRCKEEKPFTAFSRHNRNKDGLQYHCKLCCAMRHAANSDKVKSYRQAYYAKNKVRICAKVRGYRKANAEKLRAYRRLKSKHLTALKRAYYRRYPDKRREKQRRYRAKYPERALEATQRRLARLRGAFVEEVSRRKVYMRDGGLCYLCQQSVSFNRMHLEHVVPISRGGKHAYENVRLACSSCNLHKSDKTLEEFQNGSDTRR